MTNRELVEMKFEQMECSPSFLTEISDTRSFDDAIIGVVFSDCDDPRVAYDVYKVVEICKDVYLNEGGFCKTEDEAFDAEKDYVFNELEPQCQHEFGNRKLHAPILVEPIGE